MDMKDVLAFLKGEVEKQDNDYSKDGPGKEKVEEKTVDKEIVEENKVEEKTVEEKTVEENKVVEDEVVNNTDKEEVVNDIDKENETKEDKKVEEKEEDNQEEEKEKLSEVDSYKEEIARLKAALEKDRVEKVAKEYSLSVEEVDAFSGKTIEEKEDNIRKIMDKIEKQGYKIIGNSSLNDSKDNATFDPNSIKLKSY